jgi:hypothetical protein
MEKPLCVLILTPSVSLSPRERETEGVLRDAAKKFCQSTSNIGYPLAEVIQSH